MASGRLRSLDLSLKPVTDFLRARLQLVPEGRDITGRIQPEEALKPDAERVVT